MAEGNKALVRRWLDEVLTQGNLRRVDDKILDYWGEFDVMGLLRQLGVTP